MELTEIFNQCIDLSGHFLLKENGLELTKTEFLSAVKDSIRIYNKYKPYSDHCSITTSTTGKYTFVSTKLVPIPEDVITAIPASGMGGFLPIRYFTDPFNYEMNKDSVPIEYRKPNLYLPFSANYDLELIYYYRVRSQAAVSSLSSDYTSVEVEIDENSSSSIVASALAVSINAISGLSASVVNEVLTVTNDDVGVVENPASSGNTTWSSPTIIQVGDASNAQEISFSCGSDTSYSLLSNYILIATPTNTYYFWFNTNSLAKDPISSWYFIDHIEDPNLKSDYDDGLFFKLCLAKFKKQLAGSRRSFTLEEFPIANDSESMMSEGIDEEEKAIEMLAEASDADLAW